MSNKKSGFFINRIECFIVGIFPLFFSLNCYSEVKPTSSAQPKPSFFKPECAPNCEKISRIAFNFVDQDNIFTKEQKEQMSIETQNTISLINKDMKFVSIHSDNITRNGYFLSTSIRAEISFRIDTCDKTSTKVAVKIIYPEHFYINDFSCTSKDNFSCVNDIFKKEIGKKIEDYLFKPTKGSIQ